MFGGNVVYGGVVGECELVGFVGVGIIGIVGCWYSFSSW